MNKILILFIVCLCLIIPNVMGETISGTLGTTSPTIISTNSAQNAINGATCTFKYLGVSDIASVSAVESFVFFPNRYSGSTPMQFDALAPSRAETDFTASIGDTTIATGRIGYQRMFNLAGAEVDRGSFVYLIFDDGIDPTGLSGSKIITLTYTRGAIYNVTWDLQETTNNYPAVGNMVFANNGALLYPVGGCVDGGWVHYTINKAVYFQNTYVVSDSDNPLGISGTITKPYPSRIKIYGGDPESLLVTEAAALNTNTFEFIAMQSPVRVSALDSIGLTWNSSLLFAPINEYILTVTDTNLVSGQTTSGGLSSPSNTLSLIKAINYFKIQVGDDEPTYDSTSFYEVGSREKTLNYVFRSPNWYGYNTTASDYTNNKGATRPEPVSLNFPMAGTYDVGAFVYTGTNLDLTETVKTRVTVNGTAGASKVTLLLFATDATTSQFITPVNYALKNLLNNSWTNYTSVAPDGGASFSFNQGTGITGYVTAPDYYAGSFTTSLNGNNIITTPLTPINLPSPITDLSHSNLLVTVKFTNDGVQYYPLSEAKISVETYDPAEPLQTKYAYTNTEGVATFIVLNQSHNHTQTYSTVITSIIPNYKTVSKSVIVTGNLYTVQLFTQLNEIIHPSITPTTVPITPTPTPTITNIGGGVKNTTAATCGNIDGSTNIVDIFKSNIACWGVSDRFSQDLAFAALIIAFFAFIMAKYGKGLGAIVGASLGFVLSLAAGLIPIWIFFAFVIIAGLIFGLKLYGSDK